MAGHCVHSRWPNPVRGRRGGAGFRCQGKNGKFIPNRNCKSCPSSTKHYRKSGGKYSLTKAGKRYYHK